MKVFGNSEFKILEILYKPFKKYNVNIYQIENNRAMISGFKDVEIEIVTFGNGLPIYIPKKLFKRGKVKLKFVNGFGFNHLINVLNSKVPACIEKPKIIVPYVLYSEKSKNFLMKYFNSNKKFFEKLVKSWHDELKVFSSKELKDKLKEFFEFVENGF